MQKNIVEIKKLLYQNNFKFLKSLGQNFIINFEILKKMAKECVGANVAILEIGSGAGFLTKELAKVATKVISFEIDKRLLPILKIVLSGYQNVEIINKNILNIDLKLLFLNKFSAFDEIIICANLPYYMTSEIIMKILESNLNVSFLILMVQKEVAERICANSGTKKYGAISLAIKFFADAEILFEVSNQNFIPMPKVNSCVIKITVNKRNSHKIKNKVDFFNTIKFAFAQRRKNIVNSLSAGLKLPKEKIKTALNKLNIPHQARAENLSFENFTELANILFYS